MAEFLPPTASKFSQVSHKVFEYIGYSGRFHTSAFIVANLALFGCCTSLFVVTFAAPDPTTKCASQSDPTGFTTCPESQACALRDQGQPYLIKFDYDNWTQQYNMVCENAGKRQFAKSLFIFMITVCSTIILFLTDILGRKVGFLLMFISCCVGCCLGTFADDYTLKLAGFGMANASFYVYSSLFTIAFSELLPSESPFRSRVLSAMFASNPFGSILYSAVLFVTTSPTVLAWVTLVTTVVTSFLPVVVMPESPMYLLEKNKIPEFCQVVKEIRAANRLPEDPSSLADIESICKQQALDNLALTSNKSSQKSPLVQLMTNYKLLLSVVGMSIVAGTICIVALDLALNITGLGSGNSAVNGIIFNGIGMASNLFIMPFAHKMPKRKWLMIYQALFVLGGVLLVVFGKMGMLEGNNTGQKLLNLFITVGIIGIPSFVIFAPLYGYIPDLFPTEVRGTACSAIQLISNLISMTGPYVTKLAQDLNLPFMAVAGLISGVSLLVTSLFSSPKTEMFEEQVSNRPESKQETTNSL